MIVLIRDEKSRPVFEEDRVEITFYNKKNGIPEVDTLVLYGPFAYQCDSREVTREYNSEGKLKQLVPGPYQKFEIAGIQTWGIFHCGGMKEFDPAIGRESINEDEYQRIKDRFGESPYRPICYEDNGFPACRNKYREETMLDLDKVNCVDCLRILAKKSKMLEICQKSANIKQS